MTFLKLNGFTFRVPQDEQIAMVLRLASSEMSEDEWTGWVERHVAVSAP